MTKWEIIKHISAWQKRKWDKDYLSDMMQEYNVDNLQNITQRQAQMYYDNHGRKARKQQSARRFNS